MTKTPEEELADAEAKADAQFKAGFANVNPEAVPESTSPDADKDTKIEDDASADEGKNDPADKDDSPADDDPALPEEDDANALKKQIRDLNGTIGGMKQQLSTLTATVKAASVKKETGDDDDDDAPGDLTEINMEEFSELTPIRDNAVQTNKRLDALEKDRGSDQEAEQERIIGATHSDWKKQIATQEFLDYALEDGPPETAYREMQASIGAARENKDQGKEDAALDAQIDGTIDVWKTTYPEWWKTRGNDIYSADASSVVKLLDGYKAAQEATDDKSGDEPGDKSGDGSGTDEDAAHPSAEQIAAATEAERRKRRLKGNRRPKSAGGEAPDTLISDDGAFNRGFKRVAKKFGHV